MSKSGILTLGILLGLALGTFIQCSPDTPSLAALKNGEGTYFDMPEFKHDMVLAAYCDTVPADAYVHGSVLSTNTGYTFHYNSCGEARAMGVIPK